MPTTPTATAPTTLLSLPPELLLHIISHTTTSPATDSDNLTQLLTLSHVCTTLRTLITHARFLTDSRPRGLETLLRAHALNNAWTTLTLTAHNTTTPGPRAQPVQPIPLRLPGNHPHLLVLLRAQALYWAPNDDERWTPEQPTPLRVLGRPTTSTSSSTPRRHNAPTPPATDAYTAAGRLANLSMDTTSLTGAENPWQDITAAAVLPLHNEHDSTSVHLVLGRRDGTLQLATLRPSSPTSSSSAATGTLTLHSVLPFRLSHDRSGLRGRGMDDVHALDIYPLDRGTACLLAVGTKRGQLVLLRLALSARPAASSVGPQEGPRMRSRRTHPHRTGQSDPSPLTKTQKRRAQRQKQRQAQHAQPSADRAPRAHGPAAAAPAARTAEHTSHQARVTTDGPPRTRTAASAVQPEPSTSRYSKPRASAKPDTAPPAAQDHAPLPSAPESAYKEPFIVDAVSHRVLSDDCGKDAGTARAQDMTAWTVRFVSIPSGSPGDDKDGHGREEALLLAVGTKGENPLQLYAVRPGPAQERGQSISGTLPAGWPAPAAPAYHLVSLSTHDQELSQGLTAGASGVQRAQQNARAGLESGVAAGEGTPPSETVSSGEAGPEPVPVPAPAPAPSRTRAAAARTSIYALWTIAVPARALAAMPVARGGGSSPLATLLIAGYFDGTVAIYGCRARSAGSDPEAGQTAAASPLELLLRLEDPSSQDAVYALRAFWHMPTLRPTAPDAAAASKSAERRPPRPRPSALSLEDEEELGPSMGEQQYASENEVPYERERYHRLERRYGRGAVLDEPVLRVLAGSARFGCVRAWAVPLSALLLGTAVGDGASASATTRVLYTGRTLFASFAMKTFLRTRVLRPAPVHAPTTEPAEAAASAPATDSLRGWRESNAGAGPPRAISSAYMTYESSRGGDPPPPTHKVGPTFHLALDGDAGALWGEGEGGDSNAGARVWGSNEMGVWMLDFVPPPPPPPPAPPPATKDSAQGADEGVQHLVKQIAWYRHDGLRMNLRLSEDPWR